MSSYAVEPGTRIVDRYRLEENLEVAAGTSYWRAHDELLDRPVGLCLLPADADRAERVLSAARRAAVLTDARFLRVLDASAVDGVVYVVSEWVSADSLVDLLADGPLPPAEARELSLEIAAALASAHRAGLSHLCLEPEHVLRTAHGQLKVGGLAVDAAVRGVDVPDEAGAARADTEGAAAVAYAALTARWPGAEHTGLAPAPYDGNALCTPRQVRAGVPHDLDDVVCRALNLSGSNGQALSSPEELVTALAAAHVTGRAANGSAGARPGEPGAAYSADPQPPYDDAPPRRSRAALLAWTAVILVLVAGFVLALVAAVDTLRGGGTGSDDANATPSGSPTSSPSAPTGDKIAVKRVTGFDPEGDGEENDEQLPLVVDGRRSTVWITNFYNDPFGPAGLKDGVGLLLDLGTKQRVGSVTVWTVGGSTDLQLRAADRDGSSVDDFATVRKAVGVDGRAVLLPRPGEELTARYLLVWLTSLPVDGDVYRGRIAEVTVRS